jgi:hypothetical protein
MLGWFAGRDVTVLEECSFGKSAGEEVLMIMVISVDPVSNVE